MNIKMQTLIKPTKKDNSTKKGLREVAPVPISNKLLINKRGARDSSNSQHLEEPFSFNLFIYDLILPIFSLI